MDLKQVRAARKARTLRWLLGGVVLLVSAAHLLAALGTRGFSAVVMSAMGVVCLMCLPHLATAKCNIEKSALELLLMSGVMALIHLLWIGLPGMDGHSHGAHVAGVVNHHSAIMLALIALELASLALASIVMRMNRTVGQELALATI